MSMTACGLASTEVDLVRSVDQGLKEHRSRRDAEVRGYSRYVRLMKIALPIVAILLIVLIFLSGRERGGVVDLRTAADGSALAVGLQLENPRFAGMTKRGEPYVLTALTAVPDGAMPNLIDLDQPTGEITLSDQRKLTVTSRAGQMYRTDERLDLEGNVVLQTSDGYRVETDRVEMDMGQKTAVAPGALRATGPRGSIRANKVRVDQTGEDDGSATIWFDGDVKVLFRPKQ